MKLNQQLYNFVKVKSETIPVALIRRSLVKHGYPRREVDEVCRKVILEEQDDSRSEKKQELFSTFAEKKTIEPSLNKAHAKELHPAFVDISSIRKSTSPEKSSVSENSEFKTEFGNSDRIFQDISTSFGLLNEKKNAKRSAQEDETAIKELESLEEKAVPELKTVPLYENISKEKKLESNFIDLESMNNDALVKVKKESKKDTDELLSDLKVSVQGETTENIQVVKSTSDSGSSSESENIEHIVVPPKEVKHPFKSLVLRLKNFYSAFKNDMSQIDPIKLTYFLLALVGSSALLFSILFVHNKYFTLAVRFVLGTGVILMLAHNMHHLEKKYNLVKSERNAFELSVTVGLSGWLLSTAFNPLFMLLLFMPGLLFFAIIIKEIYHTQIDIALKVGALTVSAAFFSFYGIAIIIGLLSGFRALI